MSSYLQASAILELNDYLMYDADVTAPMVLILRGMDSWEIGFLCAHWQSYGYLGVRCDWVGEGRQETDSGRL